MDFITRDGEGEALTREGALTYRYNSPQPQEVHFRQFYFPGWAAAIDRVPVEVFPNREFGLLSVNVPVGEHVITLSRPGTLVQNIAPLLTLVSVVVALVFARRKRLMVEMIGMVLDHSLPKRRLTTIGGCRAVSRGLWQ